MSLVRVPELEPGIDGRQTINHSINSCAAAMRRIEQSLTVNRFRLSPALHNAWADPKEGAWTAGC
jgi:hypothetical protein